MGMYTTYTVDGYIKPKYREQFAKLYELSDNNDNSGEDDVKSVGLDILSELIKGEKWSAFIYGGWNGMEPVKFDKDTGHWTMETDIKDYSEHEIKGDRTSPEKEKRSSDIFLELVPELFEEENFELTKWYEEDPITSRYILKNGKLFMTNKKEWDEAFDEIYGPWR